MTQPIISEKEYRQCQKDIRDARRIIKAAKESYIKRRLKLRSKGQLDDPMQQYKELEQYETLQDIIEVYGYGEMDRDEYDRLCDMWEGRETFKANNAEYEDGVTLLLDCAYRGADGPYMSKMDSYTDNEKELGKRYSA